MMSRKDIYFISCILLLYVLPVENASEMDVKFKITYKHKCLVTDFVLTYFVKISLRQCVKECAMRCLCLSINYKKRLLLCELNSKEGGNFTENSSKTGPCVFVLKTAFDPEMLPCSCEETEYCDENGCPHEGSPRFTLNNGKIIGNLHTVGSKLKFECNEGYVEAEAKEYATCMSNGRWSYKPRCIIGACTTNKTAADSGITQLTNVAEKKVVNMSSVFGKHEGNLMVDGNRTANDLSCAHTKNDTGSGNYALINLGQNYAIHAIHIVNRADCCHDRLREVKITIGDHLDTMKPYVYHEPPIGLLCTFILTEPCFGRYLKIENDPGASLTICELEVYGK